MLLEISPEKLNKFNVPANDIISILGNSTNTMYSDIDSSDESNLPTMGSSFLFENNTFNTNQSSIQCEKIQEKKELEHATYSNNFDQKNVEKTFKAVRSNQLEIDQGHFICNFNSFEQLVPNFFEPNEPIY